MSGNALTGFTPAASGQPTNLLDFSASSQGQGGQTAPPQGSLNPKNTPIENGILLRTTGETLKEHVDRMSTLADNFRELSSVKGGVSQQDAQNAIVNAMGTGALQGQEAATLYGKVSDDPAQNAQLLQQLAGNIQNAADQLSPAADYLDTDPDFSGSTSVSGIPGSALATPYAWAGANGQRATGTLRDYLTQMGASTGPQIGTS